MIRSQSLCDCSGSRCPGNKREVALPNFTRLHFIHWRLWLGAILAATISMCLLELSARLIHKGRLPILPYAFDNGVPYLPACSDSQVSFYGSPSIRYMTDAGGARIGTPRLRHVPPANGVLVLGDSQALGYMLEFDESFGSLVAAKLCGNTNAARLLAAPANHPGFFEETLKRYSTHGLDRQELFILAINMGNDLDELYAEVSLPEPRNTRAAYAWLQCHSLAAMDLVLLKARREQARERRAGVNPILYLLDSAERIILARQVVRYVVQALAQARANHKLVLIIPADIQFDPEQMAKYRRYYSDEEGFRSMFVRRNEFAGMLRAIEQYIAAKLIEQGVCVLRFSELAANWNSVEGIFDENSHHLTAASHRLLADAILKTVVTP
jgi:hypothetical protein